MNDEDTNLYQRYISILRWIVKLGRLDIYVHVAFLSSHLMHPRIGHLEATYHIFAYLKRYDKSTMVFDDTYLHWKDSDFPSYDWSEFYPSMHLLLEVCPFSQMFLLMQVMLATS